MTAHAAEFFTLDEVNRLKIIQDVIDRRLTTQMAAQRLGISDRQCRRLLSRYRESGPLGMANRRRGKPSNNQLPDGLAQYALSIIRDRYTDFGPTLACEKLAELHDVHLSKETVRSLMVKAGLWIPRKQRVPNLVLMQPMILQMSLWLITTGALRKRPGMTLMCIGHLNLTMI
ncbi:transposase [Klebsiella pneumoniae]|nr:transposase [Klebsiella pneumoniae]